MLALKFLFLYLLRLMFVKLFDKIQHLIPQERIAAPHLKHDYNDLCRVESEQSEQMAPTSKFWQIFSWIFPADARQPQKDEL